MFALIDCNNFYASCERSFNPKLIGMPVVILSNNDGCVIARSNEAKLLGIPMGAPAHKFKHIFEEHNVSVLSSNFAVYGEMSHRVMRILKRFSPEQEIYSVDESFLKIDFINIDKLREYGESIVETIKRSLGIPVSVGIAQSKTLAKLANKIAKKNYNRTNGVSILIDQQEIDFYLDTIPVNEIWGIGRNTYLFLNSNGMYSALDFKKASPVWIRYRLGITGARIQAELFGQSCVRIEDIPQPKKGILSSRSFRNPVRKIEDMEEAVSTYIARAAEKLREQKSLASFLTVSIITNKHETGAPQYYNKFSIELPYPTNYNPQLIQFGIKALRNIFIKGYSYKKAGVYLSGLVLEKNYQHSLYEDNFAKKTSLMKTLDNLNYKMGDDTIFFAKQGAIQPWRMKQENTTPNYILKWNEIPVVK